MKPLVDIIILGSKPIKGMKSKGPISAIEVSGHNSILDYQIKNLYKKINVGEIFYIGGHGLSDLINNNKHNVSLVPNTDYQNNNNGYGLKLAINKSSADNILIIFNKIIFSHQIFNFFDFTKSQIFVSDNVDYGIGSILDMTNNRVLNLFYNLDNKCCGIYYIAQQDMRYVRHIIDNNNCDNLFIFEIINKSIDIGANFYSSKISEKKMIHVIQNNKALEHFKKYYAKYFSV